MTKIKDYNRVISEPRVTEKAALLADDGSAYTFNVSPRATKNEIKKAIKEIYKVEVVKVNITSIPYKKITRRGITGVKGGGKKAVVYLKKGEKIEII